MCALTIGRANSERLQKSCPARKPKGLMPPKTTCDPCSNCLDHFVIAAESLNFFDFLSRRRPETVSAMDTSQLLPAELLQVADAARLFVAFIYLYKRC